MESRAYFGGRLYRLRRTPNSYLLSALATKKIRARDKKIIETLLSGVLGGCVFWVPLHTDKPMLFVFNGLK